MGLGLRLGFGFRCRTLLLLVLGEPLIESLLTGTFVPWWKLPIVLRLERQEFSAFLSFVPFDTTVVASSSKNELLQSPHRRIAGPATRAASGSL